MPENPGETSGGDSGTPPPSVAATPGGHTDVAPHTEGSPEEAAAGSTAVGPAEAATPGGHTDVDPHGAGGPEEAAAGSTAVGPSVAATPGGHTEVSPVGTAAADEAAAGYSGAEPVVPANPEQGATAIEDPALGKGVKATSESRTGALPEVAATPSSLGLGPGGTNR